MVVAKGRFKMAVHTFHCFTEGFHEFDIFLKFLFPNMSNLSKT